MPVRIRDVAERAGVSVGTVSNVLNRPEEVSPESVERVTRAIEELGYVRNDAARKLRAGDSRTVGFVVLDGQNPFYNDVVRGAEDEATRHGIAILYGNTDEDVSRERLYLDLFQEQQVRGLLIAPYGDVTGRLQRLRASGIAAVLVDRFSGDGRFSSVSVDSVAGGRLAVEHLIETGRRRIAFVGGPFDIRQVNDRLAGARAAADNAGAHVDLEVVATGAMTVDEGAAAGARILSRPRREWPDALFAASDLVALGLLQSMTVDGRASVPGDIAIIGFDDIPFAAAAAVPLSSIRQPSRMIGRTAMRVLLEEAEDPDSIARQTVFPPELIVRASTAG
ncbi:LacI family transcriptional regulator [Microbacterium sp. EYE_5]|uniref:LacI family DNA-binding transcriptional regulator n=1 Tax=unclassified Microbacterium TaxID=2609290 RepID=UPI0020051201|nr:MULTISPECIES: LacI family DNA-binding transcriptional regulator [unclassified Microbacterium]MCK6080210.1 LacI family transcriptional regulator [Microbacterium sp. EYE_382]MCK6085481.1 LacI family transcriptional regulator [Microbacterium sp. EYE_384]MCK6122294.1 LacI family transcriptional regulator [Microbacterium sp. EYE_80]MCK6126244.1 LacI family transcriptional regulator [Microbacterium sp. EYE_79]MCK6141165.1 LacI family transcriptional regulator [Microbacterium sp. EYE_39]